MSVSGEQRFDRDRACPICGGNPSDPRGQGVRCFGWMGLPLPNSADDLMRPDQEQA